ncbi:holo-ACP synthase [Gimesia algae]|uniref:Holo-[acyl-carrier-protein] synthase n=1 Tax=Gimesia algae TaxID=2527971 RepID=A0A517VKC5_9PLAN|nr:holo-ACP synthase [Gimesia algae]QDT93468.1 Holo-[acyl-carrier-protein] synthase [Gimesia algae]
MIVGLGTDIVEISRIGQMIERHGDTFLSRVFTENENTYCGSKKNKEQHYAGRWAAKEAVMKTLGTGFIKGIGWKEIEVVNLQSGKPTIVISGGVERHAGEMGISEILITISHSREFATATAIAVGQAK